MGEEVALEARLWVPSMEGREALEFGRGGFISSLSLMKQQLCPTAQNTVINNDLVRMENCTWKEIKGTSWCPSSHSNGHTHLPSRGPKQIQSLKSLSRWKCLRWAWAKPHHFPTTRHETNPSPVICCFLFPCTHLYLCSLCLGSTEHPAPLPHRGSLSTQGSQAGERRAAPGKAQKASAVHLHICTATAARLVCRSFSNNKGILLV